MKIPLSKFESVINSVIVNRGEEYFCNDAVSGLKEIKDGEYIASVEGSEIYKVRIQLKGDIVYNHSCSCPYDMGPVCKHITAVLFAIRKNTNTKSKEETFEQAIARMPREDLNTIIADYAGYEPKFADYVSARHTIMKPSSDKEGYRQIIRI